MLVKGATVLSSHIPNILTAFSDKLTFYERLKNLVVEFMNEYLYGQMELYNSSFKKARYSDDPKFLTKTGLHNASLLFLLRHSLLDFPTPRMPDVIPISSVMARPAKPLPRELQFLMNSYSSGVIVVSFGSAIGEVSRKTMAKFIDAFRKLSQGILFRYDSDLTDSPKNVHFINWLPQNDILGHSNLKLFVSHCGMNSLIEATYHGTPMVAFPFYTDQHNNAALIKSRGIGEILSINDFTSGELMITINVILDNANYSTAAKGLSKAYKNSLLFEQHDPVFWVEHVIKYGTQYIRSRAYDIREYKYFMLDVLGSVVFCNFTVILAAAAFTTYLINVTIGCTCRKREDTIKQQFVRKLLKRR